MTEIEKNNTDPVVLETQSKKGNTVVDILTAQVGEFDFSKLRAGQINELANSGETMYLDLGRMDFVINKKEIDNNFIKALKEGAKHRKSELFNSGAIHDTEVRYDDIFNSKRITTDEQKTDSYKEEFKKFYNAGQKYIHLAPEAEDKNKDYRPLVKEFFKEIFEYAGAEIPSDAILEDLITNCNQAGCVGALYRENGPLIHVANIHNLSFGSSHTTHINCSDSHHVTVNSSEIISVRAMAKPAEEICKFDSSVEFTLESQSNRPLA